MATDDYHRIADLYDWVVPYRNRPDVAFYVDTARNSGGPVLELGCGTGRILIPTARAGVEVVGLDLSGAMLEVCRARLRKEPDGVRAAVRLVQGDMRSFAFGDRFALVTIPFRAFQHLLTVHDQLACLGRVRDHLQAGGRLALDVFNPSLEALVNRRIGEEIEGEPGFTTPDGRVVERRHRTVFHDRANQTQELELIYCVTHPDGRTERLVHAFGMRYLFRFEVEHLLARAGFRLEHIYGGFDRSAVGSADPGELIVVAKRTP